VKGGGNRQGSQPEGDPPGPDGPREMVAIRQAAEHEGSWRILDATMYVTLERVNVRRRDSDVQDPETGCWR
jgi:hypothetical protein